MLKPQPTAPRKTAQGHPQRSPEFHLAVPSCAMECHKFRQGPIDSSHVMVHPGSALFKVYLEARASQCHVNAL
jgi:hypothetical protein